MFLYGCREILSDCTLSQTSAYLKCAMNEPSSIIGLFFVLWMALLIRHSCVFMLESLLEIPVHSGIKKTLNEIIAMTYLVFIAFGLWHFLFRAGDWKATLLLWYCPVYAFLKGQGTASDQFLDDLEIALHSLQCCFCYALTIGYIRL